MSTTNITLKYEYKWNKIRTFFNNNQVKTQLVVCRFSRSLYLSRAEFLDYHDIRVCVACDEAIDMCIELVYMNNLYIKTGLSMFPPREGQFSTASRMGHKSPVIETRVTSLRKRSFCFSLDP